MTGFVLNSSAIVLCSHAGQAKPVVPSLRITLSGTPLVTIASPYVIAGCGLSTTSTPPCVTGKLISGAFRVTAAGIPLGLLNGPTTCIPTGAPMMPLLTQLRVTAA